jgi:hypothetical protein
MKETNCCVCGVRIYFDDDFYSTLRDKHQTFYCLNGHGQSFTAKNEGEQWIEMNKIIKEESNKRIQELKTQQIRLNSEISKLRSKAIHCEYCQGFFKSTYSLNRHKKKKHA